MLVRLPNAFLVRLFWLLYRAAFNATSVRDAIVTCYACQVFSSFAPSLLDVSNLDVMYLGIGAKTYQYSMWLGPCP
jgi:hypothetical protein